LQNRCPSEKGMMMIMDMMIMMIMDMMMMMIDYVGANEAGYKASSSPRSHTHLSTG
jgi:hypothetical protein